MRLGACDFSDLRLHLYDLSISRAWGLVCGRFFSGGARRALVVHVSAGNYARKLSRGHYILKQD